MPVSSPLPPSNRVLLQDISSPARSLGKDAPVMGVHETRDMDVTVLVDIFD